MKKGIVLIVVVAFCIMISFPAYLRADHHNPSPGNKDSSSKGMIKLSSESEKSVPALSLGNGAAFKESRSPASSKKAKRGKAKETMPMKDKGSDAEGKSPK